MREKIIAIAAKEVGTKESPAGSNKTKYGAWYGFDGYAWCAQFVSWVYDQAGCPLGKIDDGKGYRSCHDGYKHWKATGELTKTPQPGDIVLFDWDSNGHYEHTGIFLAAIDKDHFATIEGNTAIGNDSDGGEVMRRERKYSQAAFVHPKVLNNQ
jgi:cell wall-associated NlpC family hydrolase